MSLGRPLNWLHIPLPTHRLDSEDYEPLLALRLSPETELYLGLISAEDGELGTTVRMSMAQRYIHDFGLATACGWGRLPQDRVGRLLTLHAELNGAADPSANSRRLFVARGVQAHTRSVMDIRAWSTCRVSPTTGSKVTRGTPTWSLPSTNCRRCCDREEVSSTIRAARASC